jgi:hypothetical protein
MTPWKQALVLGSLAAGAVLLFTGRRPAGVIFATLGAAVLASEYPEKFEALWENAPEYLERGTQLVATIARIGERFAEQGPRAIAGVLQEIR